MSDRPDAPPPDSAAPRSTLGPVVGAVVLAGIVAVGAVLYTRDGNRPQNGQALQTTSPAPAASVPAAPQLFSEAIGDIEVSFPLGTASLKGVKTVNANLNKAEVTAALKGDAALLARLDAEAVSVENARILQSIAGNSGETLYDAFEARAIKSGVIGVLDLPRSRTTSRGADKSEDTIISEGMSLKKFDVPLLLHWFSESDPEGKAEFKPLYASYTIKSTRSESTGGTFEVGPYVSSGLKIRPMRRPLAVVLPEIMALAAGAAPGAAGAAPGVANKTVEGDNPAAALRVRDPVTLQIALADVLSAFELGASSIENFKIAVKVPKEEDVRIELRKIAYSGGAAGNFLLDGLNLTARNGKFALDKLEMRADVAALLLATAEAGIQARSSAPYPGDEERRKAIRARLAAGIPDASFALEGLAGEFPAPNAETQSDRLAFSLSRVALNSSRFISFTPTNFEFQLEKLDIPLLGTSRDTSVIALRELGLERIGLDARIAMDWTEASQTFAVKEISLDVAQLARLAVSAEVDGVPLAFLEDPETNWPSAMGAAIKTFVIDIVNKGGLAKLVDVAAKEQRKTGEQLRQEYSTVAPLIIAGVLAGHPDAGKIAQAATDFIRNLNSLHLKIMAAGPNGIVLTDLVTMSSNPAEFAQKLRFEVEGK